MNTHATRIHANQAAAVLPVAPSGAGIDILVVTEDDYFLLAARKVVTLPNRIWHATSEMQAADMMVSAPCAVALLDIALLSAQQLPGVMVRLRAQFPDLSFVLTGESHEREAVAALLESDTAQGFVAKQEAAQPLVEALQNAVNRHMDLRSESGAGEPQAPWKNPRLLAAVGAGALAAIILAVAAVQLMSDDEPAASAANEVPEETAPAMEAHAAQTAAVEQALQPAREAFESERYQQAAQHYQAVLAIDALNAEAKDGLNRVAEIMLARTELALVSGDTREAAEHLKSVRAIDAVNPRIKFLQAQIDREESRTVSAQKEAERIEELNRRLATLSARRSSEAGGSEKAPSSGAAAPSRGPQRNVAEADRLLALGYERLTQGNLLQPAEDSAQHHLLKLKELHPGHASLEPALTALRTKLLSETRTALDKQNPQYAREMLEGARSVGASGREVNALAADISKASLQVQMLTTPQTLQADMIERQTQPSYPENARRAGVEGYVDLRFIASTKGEVKDVVVVGAQPEGYFEEEAIRALKRWKIKPKRIDDEAYEQLLSLRLRFKLE